MRKKLELDELADQLESVVHNFTSGRVTKSEMLEYLEFSDDLGFFDAFVVPGRDSDMHQVGKKNKKIDRFYLWDAWQKGRNAGLFKGTGSPQLSHIWDMPSDRRRELISQWRIPSMRRTPNCRHVILYGRSYGVAYICRAVSGVISILVTPLMARCTSSLQWSSWSWIISGGIALMDGSIAISYSDPAERRKPVGRST